MLLRSMISPGSGIQKYVLDNIEGFIVGDVIVGTRYSSHKAITWLLMNAETRKHNVLHRGVVDSLLTHYANLLSFLQENARLRSTLQKVLAYTYKLGNPHTLPGLGRSQPS